MNLQKKQRITGILFISPFIIGFVIFFLIPFLWSISYSFTKGVGGTQFAGFQNYISIFKSSAFQLASWNTFRFIVIGVPIITIISLGIALMLYNQFKGASFFRSIFLYPLVIPIASLIMSIQFLFGSDGAINQLYSMLGFPINDWLNSSFAFWILLLLYIWKNCGYNMILILAGLNSIPNEFYQVAKLEGANEIKAFKYITLPLLEPTLFFVIVISIVNSFKCFREAYLIGGDNPDSSIYMLQHFMNNNFRNLNYQRLSVAAILIFIVICIFVFLLFLFKNRRGRIEL